MMKKLYEKVKELWMLIPLMVFSVCLVVFRFPEEVELILEDGMYQHPQAIPYQVKIIAIDEMTLKELGPYSEWDRSYFANLINYLNSGENKPCVIGIDVIFSGENESAGDTALVNAVREAGNVVLASKLDMNTRVVASEEQRYILEKYVENEVTAFDTLEEAAISGFTNAILDEDGYIRKAYAWVASDGMVYDGFAYQIAKQVMINPPEWGASLFASEEITNILPVFELVYTGNPGDFENIPMSSVLNGSIPASYFDDCIVLIGAYEEGMLDAYSVSIDHSKKMYGVELQANTMWAILTGKKSISVNLWIQVAVTAMVTLLFGYFTLKKPLRYSLISLGGILVLYPSVALLLNRLGNYKLYLIYLPIGVGVEFLVLLLVRYIRLQKKRNQEMQKTLFSMADSMAEAIEGRTPYNANHTKNVAKRCIEMLDYINEMHKEKRTELYFTEADKKQLYLAAMLHDIGKMDVPLEVMDKPTKLGSREDKLRDRLLIIKLMIQKDALTGVLDEEDAKNRVHRIEEFLGKLGLFNCGKPLNDEEKAFIEEMARNTYPGENGEEIPYLTEEEADDLRIRAGTLSDAERKIMQSHVVHTEKILSHVYFGSEFADVKAMASNHHELLNAKGYPLGLGAEELDVMTRILTIMDIFDSLIADDRPYKKPKTVKVAFEILEEEAEAGKVDSELLKIAEEIWMKEE